MQGNNNCALLIDINLILLTTGFTIHRIASLDEVVVHITSKDSNVYSNPVISQRLKDLEVSRKCTSNEVHEEFSNRNLLYSNQ